MQKTIIRAFTLTISFSTLLTMNGKKLYRVNPAYNKLNYVPKVSEIPSTFLYHLPQHQLQALFLTAEASKSSISPRQVKMEVGHIEATQAKSIQQCEC